MSYREKEKSHESKRFPIDKKHHEYKEEEHYKVDRDTKHDQDKNHGKDEQVCVEEVLEAILKAQRKVEAKDKKKCTSSCKESIEDLLEEHRKPKKNTIPFILFCGCDPFKASGVTTTPGGPKDKKFACIESFIFKINDLKGQCAELELLTFKSKKDGKKDENKKDGHHKEDLSLCDQIDHERVEDLEKTGICINVDLSCFCGITCLPAVYLKDCVH